MCSCDSDDSYDFSRLDLFLDRLREGSQLVMGNRFAGGIQPGAMPPLHRYLGNPVLSTLGRVLFRSPCKDFHCGLRGFERDAILHLDLSETGMEFASEMVVKATVAKLRIAEVPTSLSPDDRDRPPHLQSWRDGWRHLRFLLLFSPSGLFFYPGACVFGLGALAMLRLLIGPVIIGSVGFDINTLMYASAATVIGWQSMIFWVCAKIHGTREGMVAPDPIFERTLGRVTLERALLTSLAMFLLGLLLAIGSLVDWGRVSFHALDPSHSMRLVIPAATAMLLAVQAAYGAMFMTFLKTTVYDGITLPFPDRSFDCILMFNVLHHVPIAARAAPIRECRRVAGSGPIYTKDHISTDRLDDVRLAVLDLLGNVPFHGMLSASYLRKQDWNDIANETGHVPVEQLSGAYRSGVFGALFPNRLETSMKWCPA